MKKIKLSIIVLSWNTKALLKQCLESLIPHTTYPAEGEARRRRHIPHTEIIVVDNGSKDGSVEWLKGLILKQVQDDRLKMKVIFNKKNLGFARGNNQAIRQAKGEYVMLINSDTVMKKGALEKLIKFLDDRPEVAAVSPLLLNLDGTQQTEYYMKFPNLWQVFFYHNPILRILALKISFLRGRIVSQADSSQPFRVDVLPGAALMARKKAWGVGLLNEDYQFLFEDVDWCWRAKEQGYKLMVVPDSKITHIGGASWKKKVKENSRKFYYQFFSSMLLFVQKNYGRVRSLIFRFGLVIHLFVTLKPRLAFWFLFTSGKQKKLWR